MVFFWKVPVAEGFVAVGAGGFGEFYEFILAFCTLAVNSFSELFLGGLSVVFMSPVFSAKVFSTG